jgi:hypothetical protein
VVCEDRQGHLSQIYPVAGCGSVAVYRLPFWHYTTPLQARRGRERAARGWRLLLANFEIAPAAVAPPQRRR